MLTEKYESKRRFSVLNKQFMTFIKNCVEINPYADLSPTVEDYLGYVNMIKSDVAGHGNKDSDDAPQVSEKQQTAVLTADDSLQKQLVASPPASSTSLSFIHQRKSDAVSSSSTAAIPASPPQKSLVDVVGFGGKNNEAIAGSIQSTPSFHVVGVSPTPSFSQTGALPTFVDSKKPTLSFPVICLSTTSSFLQSGATPAFADSIKTISPSHAMDLSSAPSFPQSSTVPAFVDSIKLTTPFPIFCSSSTSCFPQSSVLTAFADSTKHTTTSSVMCVSSVPSFPQTTYANGTPSSTTERTAASFVAPSLFGSGSSLLRESTTKTFGVASTSLFQKLSTAPSFGTESMPFFGGPSQMSGITQGNSQMLGSSTAHNYFQPVMQNSEDDAEQDNPEKADDDQQQATMGYEPDSFFSTRSKLFLMKNGEFTKLGVGIFNMKAISDDDSSVQLIFRLESSRAGSVLMNIRFKRSGENFSRNSKKSLIVVSVANPLIPELTKLSESETRPTVSYLIMVSSEEEMDRIIEGITKR